MATNNASATVNTLIATAKMLSPRRAVLIRGNHGIGKSDIVRQLGEYFGAEVLDYRLGQRTPGDIVGMPDIKDGLTRFCTPAELMPAFERRCILFFDEMNRATDEVLQSVFEMCLDRRHNGRMLHPETRVYAAINTKATYNVNRLDPALLDRFFTVDLECDPEQWCRDWAPAHKIDQDVIDFIRAHADALTPTARAESESVQPTPRSWHMFSDELVNAGLAGKPNDASFYALAVGFLGTEVATAFTGFAKNLDSRVTGIEIINSYTLDPVSKENHVLKMKTKDWKEGDKFKTKTEVIQVGKLQAKVRTLTQDRWLGLLDEVGTFVSKLNEPPKDKKTADLWGKNIQAFMRDLPEELRVAFWASMARRGVESVEVIKWFHPHVVHDVVTGVFKVPVGEEGIGVQPDIPPLLKAQMDEKNK